MSMTDPIADMLTRLRNASAAHHDEVAMPHSKIKGDRHDPPVRGLRRRRAHRGCRRGPTLDRGPEVRPEPRALHLGVRRVSKPGLPGLRQAWRHARVLGGLGIAIISTSSGLLTDRQAEQKGVGGEVLAYVW